MKHYAGVFLGVPSDSDHQCASARNSRGPPGSLPNRWTIPDGAVAQPNPLASTPAVLEKGKALYATHCLRCHGAAGKNDGPASDPSQVNADLTDDYRTSTNSDGVVFDKIWYGFGRMGASDAKIRWHTLAR
jgi:hypothetical protein